MSTRETRHNVVHIKVIRGTIIRPLFAFHEIMIYKSKRKDTEKSSDRKNIKEHIKKKR